MMPKRKEPKRKSIATTFMRDLQGSPAAKLAMFQGIRAAGGFELAALRAQRTTYAPTW